MRARGSNCVAWRRWVGGRLGAAPGVSGMQMAHARWLWGVALSFARAVFALPRGQWGVRPLPSGYVRGAGRSSSGSRHGALRVYVGVRVVRDRAKRAIARPSVGENALLGGYCRDWSQRVAQLRVWWEVDTYTAHQAWRDEDTAPESRDWISKEKSGPRRWRPEQSKSGVLTVQVAVPKCKSSNGRSPG